MTLSNIYNIQIVQELSYQLVIDCGYSEKIMMVKITDNPSFGGNLFVLDETHLRNVYVQMDTNITESLILRRDIIFNLWTVMMA